MPASSVSMGACSTGRICAPPSACWTAPRPRARPPDPERRRRDHGPSVFTIPLFDDTPTRRPAILTWVIIFACAAVFLWQIALPPAAQRDIVYSLGVVPAVPFGGDQPPREHPHEAG